MSTEQHRTICWTATWNKRREAVGLEHLLLTERSADSIVLAFDDELGPFRLAYRLAWDESWRLRDAELIVATDRSTRSLALQTDGQGRWRQGDGRAVEELDGCMDIDIWPTPFTNSFPIRRERMAVGERRQFRMAWIFGPDLSVRPQPQAYTRIAENLYCFENLDGSGFNVELPVDDEGIVVDYPRLFRRVKRWSDPGTTNYSFGCAMTKPRRFMLWGAAGLAISMAGSGGLILSLPEPTSSSSPPYRH